MAHLADIEGLLQKLLDEEIAKDVEKALLPPRPKIVRLEDGKLMVYELSVDGVYEPIRPITTQEFFEVGYRLLDYKET